MEGKIKPRNKERGTERGSFVFSHPIDLHLVLAWEEKTEEEEKPVRERSEQPRGWPRDISRLYARPTPNFAELPYDSIYPILPARPPAPSYDSVPPQLPSRYTDLEEN